MKKIALIFIISVCWFTFYKQSQKKLFKRLLIESSRNMSLMEENAKFRSLINDLVVLPANEETIKENKLIIKHFR